MPRRRRPKRKGRSLLDRLIFRGELYLYEQERILEDSRIKSQIFNNIASVRVKQSRVALNNARLRRIDLQNRILEKALLERSNNNGTPPAIPGAPDANVAYCSICQTHLPMNTTNHCGSPVEFQLLDMRIGENYGK